MQSQVMQAGSMNAVTSHAGWKHEYSHKSCGVVSMNAESQDMQVGSINAESQVTQARSMNAESQVMQGGSMNAESQVIQVGSMNAVTTHAGWKYECSHKSCRLEA